MKPITASFILFIVIVLCGYVVTNSTGIYKVASFALGILATIMTIYIHRKSRSGNDL